MSRASVRYRVYLGAVVLALAARGFAQRADRSVPELNLYRVRGTIAYNGQPVDGALLTAYSDNEPYLAMAVADEKGEFSFFTGGKPGALAGRQRAAASQYKKEDVSEVFVDRFSMQMTTVDKRGKSSTIYVDPNRNRLPEDFGDPRKSGLEFVVEEHDDNIVELRLED